MAQLRIGDKVQVSRLALLDGWHCMAPNPMLHGSIGQKPAVLSAGTGLPASWRLSKHNARSWPALNLCIMPYSNNCIDLLA